MTMMMEGVAGGGGDGGRQKKSTFLLNQNNDNNKKKRCAKMSCVNVMRFDFAFVFIYSWFICGCLHQFLLLLMLWWVCHVIGYVVWLYKD